MAGGRVVKAVRRRRYTLPKGVATMRAPATAYDAESTQREQNKKARATVSVIRLILGRVLHGGGAPSSVYP